MMSNVSKTEDNGFRSVNSVHDVKSTVERLEGILKEKGMNIFARVNHTGGAEKIGEILRPTELIIFGNPQTGTPLMQSNQSIAIDLPQKILVWEDELGKVWLSYNDPSYLVQRHNINDCGELIQKIANALASIAEEASE